MTGITKETFKEADTHTKLDILFDYIKDIYNLQETQNGTFLNHIDVCNAKFYKLNKKKMKDTAIASGFGFIGGFSAVLAKLKIWG